jgi:O-antigen/teichoic acid export membrane protein
MRGAITKAQRVGTANGAPCWRVGIAMPSKRRRVNFSQLIRRFRLEGEQNAISAGAFERVNLAKRLARGSGAAFLIQVCGIGLTYIAQVATARMIGAADYGVYAYVFAWVTGLAYVAALGFNISLLRFVPAYVAERAFPLLRGIIEYASRRVGIAGCGIAVTGIILILAGSRHLPFNLLETFVLGLPLVPIQAVLRVRAAIVRGFGGVVSALAPERLVRETVLLLLTVSAGSIWKIDATWAMGATLVGAVAGLLIVSMAMHRLKPGAVKMVAPAYEVQLWRRTAMPLVVVGLTEALMNRTGIMVLGWLGDTREAGIYAAVFNIAFVAILPRAAINTLLAPAFSNLFVQNDRAGLRVIVMKASIWTLSGAIAIALPIFVLAKPALAMFGPDFVSGVQALRILLVGQVMVAAAGSQLQLMNMTGNEGLAAKLLVFSAIANAGIAATLVGALGTTGAAIAGTTAMIGWNAAMAMAIWRRLRLLPGVLSARL